MLTVRAESWQISFVMPPRKRIDIRALAKDPRFISGIYNYCDRWCERCPLSSRCLNYAMEKASDEGDPEARDVRNEKFWNKLHDVFAQTREMVEEMAKEQGIDLTNLDTAEARAAERRERRALAKERPIIKAANAYIKMVDDWFDEEVGLLEAESQGFIAKAKLGVREVLKEATELKDVVEVIRWYQFFISVKLQRAITSRADEDADAEEREFPRDSEGSAKIALIALDRSIEAWVAMRTRFPEKTDDILDVLVHLDRLRRAVEKTFPDARKFVRPGFDTGGKPVESE
ncbi:MAG: hypothetical protein AB1705_21980 [Verrucomicrobiota bacterium]